MMKRKTKNCHPNPGDTTQATPLSLATPLDAFHVPLHTPLIFHLHIDSTVRQIKLTPPPTSPPAATTLLTPISLFFFMDMNHSNTALPPQKKTKKNNKTKRVSKHPLPPPPHHHLVPRRTRKIPKAAMNDIPDQCFEGISVSDQYFV